MWTSENQALLFASMFWGGLLSTIPAGWLADRYGPKNLCLGSVMVNVIGTMITPFVAEHAGYLGLFAVRFVMGFGQVKLSC